MFLVEQLTTNCTRTVVVEGADACLLWYIDIVVIWLAAADNYGTGRRKQETNSLTPKLD